eukprot:12401640-Karenia_brevis.AAC.1
MRRIQWKICREQENIAELTYERMRLQEAAGEEFHASWCAQYNAPHADFVLQRSYSQSSWSTSNAEYNLAAYRAAA